MNLLWIKNGRVIDPANQRDAAGDVYAVDGNIVERLRESQKSDDTVVDASGIVVAP